MLSLPRFALLSTIMFFSCFAHCFAQDTVGKTEGSSAKGDFYTDTQDISFSTPEPQGVTSDEVVKVKKKKPAKKPAYIGMRVELLKVMPDGREMPVSINHTFTSGDHFRMIVTSNSAGYVYVYNQYNDTPETLVYPKSLENSEQVGAMRHVILPATGSFKFDEGQPGTERMKIVLAAEPLSTRGESGSMVAIVNPVPESGKSISFDSTSPTALAATQTASTITALYVTTPVSNMGNGSKRSHLVHQFDLTRK